MAAAASSSSSSSSSADGKHLVDASKTDDEIMVSVCNQLYGILERLLATQLITEAHLLKPPPWLSKGVLRVAFLEALQRSLNCDGIQLAAGKTITLVNCPSKHLVLFQALSKSKQLLVQAKLSPSDGKALQRVLLYDDMKHADVPSSPSAWLNMQQLAQILSTVATQLTAAPFWKDRWAHILNVLNSQCHSQNADSSSSSSSSSSSNTETKDIWLSVLNRCYEVGEEALRDKLISADDVKDQNSFLYLGIVGATILDAIKRSLPLALDAIALASRRIVTLQACPADLKELMVALTQVKKAVIDAKLTDVEWVQLRTVVLWASSDDKPEIAFFSAQRKAAINAIAAGIQSIATQVSQMNFFKTTFNDILILLAASCE